MTGSPKKSEGYWSLVFLKAVQYGTCAAFTTAAASTALCAWVRPELINAAVITGAFAAAAGGAGALAGTFVGSRRAARLLERAMTQGHGPG